MPYRSLIFELEHKNVTQAQPVVQVNYPNQYLYTRTSEFKLLQKEPVKDKTVLVYEYPVPCTETRIPYYPVESEENRTLYKKYKELLEPVKNLYLLGRLAEYQYYNMDITIYQAMNLSYKLIGEEKNGDNKGK